MIEKWRGIVNTIAYRVQYADKLDDALAAGQANQIVTKPDYDAPEEQYADLAYAVESGTELTRLISDTYSESDFREFLANVLRHLDDLRPWPELPFRPLRISEWDRFVDARPLARINMRWVRVEERVHQVFRQPSEGSVKRVVLRRMASGAELALVAESGGGDHVDVLARNVQTPPATVISELTASTALEPENLTPLPA